MGNKSITEVHEAQETSLYFGYTGREDHRAEHLSFLNKRGMYVPILIWPNDGGTMKTITKTEAETILDFDSIVLYESNRKYNARSVESALQEHVAQLQLKPGNGKRGVQLWIRNDAGSKHDYSKEAGKKHKVFLTFSSKALEAIDAGTIKFNERKLSFFLFFSFLAFLPLLPLQQGVVVQVLVHHSNVLHGLLVLLANLPELVGDLVDRQ